MHTSFARKAAALAVAVAVTAGGAAQAGPVTGTGGGTGIIDWLAVYQDVGNGHSARGYCEYAVNPGPTGHFEAGVNAMTGGSLTPSQDVQSLSVSCAFYDTATGTLVLSDSGSGSSAQKSHDQGVRRPRRICLSANVKWNNGDTFSVFRCKWGRISWWQDDTVAVEAGLDEPTETMVEGAAGTAAGCSSAAARCAAGAAEYAGQVERAVREGWQPGVQVDVSLNPGTTG